MILQVFKLLYTICIPIVLTEIIDVDHRLEVRGFIIIHRFSVNLIKPS